MWKMKAETYDKNVIHVFINVFINSLNIISIFLFEH